MNEITVGALSEVGPRNRNEDRVFAVRGEGGSHVIAVADGLGGHPRGDEAAEAALRGIPTDITGESSMAEAFAAANKRVGELRDGQVSMGNIRNIPMTTLAVVSYVPTADGRAKTVVAWSGDTLAFRLVRQGGALLATSLGRGHNDEYGTITCCLGFLNAEPEIHVFDSDAAQGGEGLAVLSDGAWEPLVKHAPHPDGGLGFEIPAPSEWVAMPVAEHLIRQAEALGWSDNASVAALCAADE